MPLIQTSGSVEVEEFPDNAIDLRRYYCLAYFNGKVPFSEGLWAWVESQRALAECLSFLHLDC